MSDEHSVILSEDEDDYDDESSPQLQSTLSKWTNYIHGWQDRFIVLKDSTTLSYYKSENETSFGCRGSISVHRASIKAHEYDELRFDVCVNDCVWYLRCDSADQKFRWVEALEACKVESGYGSTNNLRRHGSALSITSASLSTTSTSSFKKGRSLREKLAEMETFKDIMCRQIDTLQGYFDNCAETLVDGSTVHDDTDEDFEDDGSTTLKDQINSNLNESPVKKGLSPTEKKNFFLQHGSHAIDFKGEALTFKATTNGILAILSHCVDLVNQREESWKRRIEKEVEKRKKLEELYRQAISEARSQQPIVLGGPDHEEGPHSTLNEDEFFDAIDAALDKTEKEEEGRIQKVKNKPIVNIPKKVLSVRETLMNEINRLTFEQLKYAKMGVGEGGWELFAEEGEMKLYKREVVEQGMVCDPLKAVHTVKGVTGHEICHYFYEPAYRFDWEISVEDVNIIEKINDDTLVFHQVFKRVWPASQRDAVFWSYITRVPNEDDQDAQDIWIVCNNSIDHPDAPVTKAVRLSLTVSLCCQTFIDPPPENTEITRDNIRCRVMYCSTINPGGWAPASVLRAVYKREYPKFLKRFTQYVKGVTDKKPIMF
ncbi:Collagen type IV alpha-3-binding protein [Nymphon striatum]|nr:Collagen type IV alpha-3-binding protein [Nymphon striatum]